MPIFWTTHLLLNTTFEQQFEYISDPSIDLIKAFRNEIIQCVDPKTHRDYVQCDNVERSNGCLLFILKSRVEIIIKPNYDIKSIYFVSCEDN